MIKVAYHPYNTVFEPTEHRPGPRSTWLVLPGFGDVSEVVWCLSRQAPYRHPSSVFAGLPEDRVITAGLPRLKELRDYCQYALDLLDDGSDAAFVGGLSLGGNYASWIYQLWRSQRPSQRHPRRLGLVMISTPATAMQLRPSLRKLAAVGRHLGPIPSTRLYQLGYYRMPERRMVRERPDLGPAVSDLIQWSGRESGKWMARTMADVLALPGLGEPMSPQGSVVSINLARPELDDVLDLVAAEQAIEDTYPGVHKLPLDGVTRHGTLLYDGRLYAPVVRRARDHVLSNWGLM